MSPVPYAGTVIAPNSSTMTSNVDHHIGASAGAAYGGHSGSAGSAKAHFRHIDDVVSVTVDLDPHAPMRKVLEVGDGHMRQAIAYKDFGRPDMALQEYMKAIIIAVHKVPRHKDYPTLKKDREDLNRMYLALQKKIKHNGAEYDTIKEIIKEDNARSGVRPKKAITRPSENPLPDLPSVPSTRPWSPSIDSRDTARFGHMRADSGSVVQNEDSPRRESQLYEGSRLERKTKPIVHPKPQALHGNSLSKSADKASPDLVTRFANLRSSPEQPKSVSPPSTRLIGPRPMPLPTMPKIPDAVYSPARGIVTSEAANLPSSTPRGVFSRTNSLVSTPGRSSMEGFFRPSNGEQFVAAHTYGDLQASSTGNLRIPQGEHITVKELIRCMRDASTHPNTKILLIDVRDRQLFDEGHIMSQNTICLDPTILSRRNISANDIVDSMILAPSNEKSMFERRNEMDLVVFYDQDSRAMPHSKTGNAQEMTLYNLMEALVHYNFPGLRHTPKLLVGGLDAWVDEMGMQSLQTSQTQSILRRATSTSRQRLKNRALKPDEVDTFEAMIGRDEHGDFDYTKSRDDFMRRFPSLGGPESMTSNGAGTSVHTAGVGSEEFLKDMTPMPPVRPKPSVARTRYSGLQSLDEHPSSPGSFAMTASAPANAPRKPPPPTGLVNPHNWCYANASIQALLVCRGFVDEFLDAQWPTKYRPQVEPTDPAYNQLMCKILGNLFQWLSQRSFTTMKASTLMHYVRTIHAGYYVNGQLIRFGDGNQHDSDEFITFIFGQIQAETRLKLTMNTLPPLDTTQPVGFVADRWGNRGRHNLISRYWYLMELQTLQCNKCKAMNFISEEAERYQFPVPHDRDDGTLEGVIKEHFAGLQVDSNCDKCGSAGKQLSRQIVRLPPLLRVGLSRAGQKLAEKATSKFQFPLVGLDLSRYALDAQQRFLISKIIGGEAAEGFDCSAKYDLYAVVCHDGTTMMGGHYNCLVRTQYDGKWTRCNDSQIMPGLPDADACHIFYPEDPKKIGPTPVQLYYRRVDAP